MIYLGKDLRNNGKEVLGHRVDYKIITIKDRSKHIQYKVSYVIEDKKYEAWLEQLYAVETLNDNNKSIACIYSSLLPYIIVVKKENLWQEKNSYILSKILIVVLIIIMMVLLSQFVSCKRVDT